jgi:hypothetical protein
LCGGKEIWSQFHFSFSEILLPQPWSYPNICSDWHNHLIICCGVRVLFKNNPRVYFLLEQTFMGVGLINFSVKIAIILRLCVIAFLKAAVLSCVTTADLNHFTYFGFYNWKKCVFFWWCLVSNIKTFLHAFFSNCMFMKYEQ